MAPMAATLVDDAAIADIAAYVATLKPAPVAPTVVGDATKGAAAFALCGTCHGVDARGMVATGEALGPGGWSRRPLDLPRLGPHQPGALDELAERIAEVVRQAHAALAPAQITAQRDSLTRYQERASSFGRDVPIVVLTPR